jgi:hypothetical protein
MAGDYPFNPEKDRPIRVDFQPGSVSVTLADGRVISNPIDWHPWLRDTQPHEREHYELRAFSVDWPELDEGLDIEGMLRGVPSAPAPGRSVEIVTG